VAYHTWAEDELRDPGECPHSKQVRCVTDKPGTLLIVPNAKRNCGSCAWGPNGATVCAKRLEKLKEVLGK